MSQFRIQRKRSTTPRNKIHSEESRREPFDPSFHPSFHPSFQPSFQRSFQRSFQPMLGGKLPGERGHTKKRLFVRQVSQECSLSTKDPNCTLEEGMRAYRLKDTHKALAIFKKLYKLNPTSQLAYLIGSCLLNLGQHRASIVHLNTCLMANPAHSAHCYLYIAINFKMLGKLHEAVKILEDGLTRFPSFEEGHFYVGKLYTSLGKYEKAASCFRMSWGLNRANPLTAIMLGDCVNKCGDSREAMDLYDGAMRMCAARQDPLLGMAVMRTISLLVDMGQFKQAQPLIDAQLRLPGEQKGELHYLKGLTSYHLNDRPNASVYLETCTLHSNHPKAFILLMKMHVQDYDFFGAEHLLVRTTRAAVPQELILPWRYLIEAVNDMIKHKMDVALEKLSSAKKAYSSQQEYMDLLYPHYAYCLFLNGEVDEAISAFAHSTALSPRYNKCVLQGLKMHKDSLFEEADRKLERAYAILPKIEVVFLRAINLVQQYLQDSEQKKECILAKVEQLLMHPHDHSLLYFYESLLHLFMDKPSLKSISKAISLSEEPVSEYYFIKAMTHSLMEDHLLGLEAMHRAIEIEDQVSEFYKERSKYYCVLEKYDYAIEDCLKCASMGDSDDEAELLLTFYYYLDGQYDQCHRRLTAVLPAQDSKFIEFQQAVMLRKGHYQHSGAIGPLLAKLEDSSVQLQQNYLAELERLCASRKSYSEITVYFYHVTLGIHYSQEEMYSLALSHLFCAREEMKMEKIGKKELMDRQSETAFNIVLVYLLQQDYTECCSFISTVLDECTAETQWALRAILGLVRKDYAGETLRAIPFEDALSENYPELCIGIHDYTLITTHQLLFPLRLKFSIAPQFDVSYIYNFDIDKVEQKLIPSWLKSSPNFTDQLHHEQLELSQTQVSNSEYLDRDRASPDEQEQQMKEDERKPQMKEDEQEPQMKEQSPKEQMKEKLRLGRSMEARLNLFINKK